MSTADRTNPGNSVRTAVAWDAVRSALEGLAKETGRDAFDVVDLGGGTGGFAVALARLGHRVTVVDPSPDALAALERRVAEAGVRSAVRAAQGDLATAFDVVDPESADAVLCHGVLEFADDPAEGCRTAARLLRPGGLASVLAANRTAVVLARVLGGHVAEALAALRDPAGRFGAHDPVPRRFGEAELRGLVEAAGLTVRAVHGVRIFADLVPGATGADPAAGTAAAATVRQLLELESAAGERPEFRSMAAQLHVLAARDAGLPV